MAPTATLAPPAAPPPELAYEAAQEHVAVLLAPVVAEVFAGLAPDDLLSRLPALRRELAAIVARFGAMSARSAIAYYRRARLAAGVTASLPVLAPAPPPPLEQVARGLDYATRHLQVPEPTQEDIAAVIAEATAITERHALNTGRATILGATLRDTEAKGWARGLEPGACSFCAMLALRGAVFKRHSFDASNARFEGGGYSIKVHDHCRCHPVPVFGRYEQPADVKVYADLWKTSTKGLSGADARKAFRAAVENRDFIPPRQKPGRKSVQGKAPEGVYTTPTPERAAAMIQRLEAARSRAEKAGNSTLAAHSAATIERLRAHL